MSHECKVNYEESCKCGCKRENEMLKAENKECWKQFKASTKQYLELEKLYLCLKEKKIAKKPLYNEDKTFAFCNHCDEEKGLLNEWDYCPRCGGKIDWSE